jgi:hypothetical protein|tara:strand:- start:1893 stop:2105 length:213 start_codon:yes stop_codon:yes gene_type:complete
MGYNIIKIMKDKEGKPIHILLTDGLSQILELKNEKKAIKMVKLFNENSDSGWKYALRPSPCPKETDYDLE